MPNTENNIIGNSKEQVEVSILGEGKSLVNRGILGVGEIPKTVKSVYSFTEDEISNFIITSRLDDLVNEISVLYAYNWAENKFTKSITKKETSSQLLYGTRKPSPIERKFLQNTYQANTHIDSILRTNSFPVYEATFTHTMKSFYVEVGDIIDITHSAGIGSNGWNRQICDVVEKSMSTQGEISYKVVSEQSVKAVPVLLKLSETPEATKESIGLFYEDGLATLTIVSDTDPPKSIKGITVRIGSVTQATNDEGQVRFRLSTGKHKAYLSGQGYENVEYEFFV